VPWCEVTFIGKNAAEHVELVEAGSLYEAAAMAIERVTKLWWFDIDGTMIVRPLKASAEYRLTPSQVRAWRQHRKVM
jgi:hypothetical protein